MRRTIRGRGARGFVPAPHAFTEWHVYWGTFDCPNVGYPHETALVSTAQCTCGKRDTRVLRTWDDFDLPLKRGEGLVVMRPVDFRKCRELPPLLSMRGAPA